MFERILLPLDGSQLAELAIPYGEELGGRLGSELLLLHVCTPEQRLFSHMHELYCDGMVNAVQREVKKKFPRCEGCQVRAEEILIGEPADVICDYVQKNGIGLIILTTHGASGVKGWTLGSVVDKVVRAVDIPILLIRAKEGRLVSGKKRLISRILLPLDGSDASKHSVPYALELAKRLKGSITLFGMVEELLHVVPYSGHAAEECARMRAADERNVRNYLTGVEKELRQEGVRVTHVVTRGFDAAHEILEQEKKANADLVVMATRGRSRIARWTFGSVAEKVLREGDLPLLVVREASD